MKSQAMRILSAMVLAVVIGFVFKASADEAKSDEVKAGNLVIRNIWARPSPGQPNSAAAFMVIENKGKQWDRLVAASSPAAEMTVLHKSSIMSGLLKMFLTKGIFIDPGASLTMNPDEFHIMLVTLTKEMNVGETFPLTLTFEKAGEVLVQVLVKKDTGYDSKASEREKKGL